ncbi:FAD dependent oxidoreductase-domain-containing protein [Pisolithus croceorrhizus]|nr:FAD dependent oxidoreductase-domain-containing protein [Pisolithus croceorrhizus]
MLGRSVTIALERSKDAQATFDAIGSVPECLHQPANLPSANPTRSFWAHSSPDANPLAREGSHGSLTTDADICIIGSGISGISVAYHIAEAIGNKTILDAPLRVVILEARDFCSGATGRNGDFAERQNRFGTDEAIRSSALEQYTCKVDLGQRREYPPFFHRRRREGSQDRFRVCLNIQGINLDGVQWLTRAEVENSYGAPYSAVKIHGHNLWPLKLVTMLYEHAKQRTSEHFNLRIHTHTPVTSITRLSSEGSNADLTYILSTPRGSLSCSRVVHATNAYASRLLPSLAGPNGIIPTRGQVVATRASLGQAPTKTNGWIGNRGYEYWFPRSLRPGEETPLVILGGGREASGPQFELYVDDDSSINPVVGKELRGFLPAVFEGKSEHGNEPEMEWTGIMGYTTTGDPCVGSVFNFSTGEEAYEGQYIAAGYTGHGMPRAFACAEVVVQMIVAELTGTQWSCPTWLPKRYLTQNRLKHKN